LFAVDAGDTKNISLKSAISALKQLYLKCSSKQIEKAFEVKIETA